MPIIGLTDPDSIMPRLPRLGKLRKGGEKSANKPGADLNHFRFTSQNPEIVAAFEKAFGKEPKSLIVFLPYRNVDECFPTWCEIWNASGLEHRCDGQNMVIWREGDKMKKGAKQCAGGHRDNDPRKDAVGRLEVLIPQLIEAGFVGTVTMETHADGNDMPFIFNVLNTVFSAREDLRGVPFRLYRQLENIGIPGYGDRAGQRARADKWLVKIEPVAEFMRAQIAASQLSALALSAPARTMDAETGEIIEGEAKLIPTAPPPGPTGQPPASGTAGSGKPAANGKRETVKIDGKNLFVDDIKARWDQLWQWKIALGAEYPAIRGGATPEQYYKAAQMLKETLVNVANNIVDKPEKYKKENDLIMAAIEAMKEKA